MYHPNIWVPRFHSDFIPAIRRVEDVFLTRIPPTFSSIEDESEKLEHDLWEQANALPFCEDGPDEGQIAEHVREVGADFRLGLMGMQQGLLNCCALFLYHLHEQQLMIFLRQELLGWKEKGNTKLYTHKEINKRLSSANTNLNTFKSWAKVEELKNLANAIKHGEGDSSAKLLKTAPHLFELTTLGNQSAFSPRVYAPLLGDDICVKPSHINEYADALEQFWIELGDALNANMKASFT